MSDLLGPESSLARVILGFEPRSSERRMSGAGKGKSTAAISLEMPFYRDEDI